MQIKMGRMFISGLLAGVLAFTAFAPAVFAQALSAEGVATGGDKVSAIVPQAASIFQVIDIVENLQDEIVECARQGYFYDQNTDTCRQGVAPEVNFFRGVVAGESGAYVDVENAYGQTRPANALPSSPDDFSRYGNLDGEDGVTTCLDTGGNVVACP